MTDVELAWVTGLFEGEGCSYRRKASKRIVLQLSMVDEDVITRLHKIVQMGVLSSRPLPSGKTAYIWTVSKCDDAVILLNKMLPFLSVRRATKARLLLKDWDESEKPYRLRIACIHGHPFSGDNLVLTDNRRRCRACAVQRQRKYRALQLG